MFGVRQISTGVAGTLRWLETKNNGLFGPLSGRRLATSNCVQCYRSAEYTLYTMARRRLAADHNQRCDIIIVLLFAYGRKTHNNIPVWDVSMVDFFRLFISIDQKKKIHHVIRSIYIIIIISSVTRAPAKVIVYRMF